ncbi:MAG: helix-turn-helix transcriptional regulator [Acidimicrobiales bacterium]
MSTMQLQARALGDPTRHDIFQHVVAAEGPVGVAELTAHFGLNHNAIRQHLAKLVSAELLVEETAPSSGRGRPRLQYLVDPRAESRWGVQGPYERLSLWLAEMVRTGDTAVDVGRRVGRRRRLGATDSDDPLAELMHQMASHGFEPVVRQSGAKADITLRACPFPTTALADPDTVCELHLGIAYGIADNLGGLVIDELVPNDPRRANCHLRCHLEAGAASQS